jgi:hypothetical protein
MFSRIHPEVCFTNLLVTGWGLHLVKVAVKVDHHRASPSSVMKWELNTQDISVQGSEGFLGSSEHAHHLSGAEF